MTKSSEYRGQHREQDPNKVVDAATRLLIKQAIEATSEASTMAMIAQLPADQQALAHRAMQG